MSQQERSVAEVVGLLANESGVATVCQEVTEAAKAGRWEQLVALAKALEEGCSPGDSPEDKKRRSWFEAACDHVEDQLALCAGDPAIDALLALSLDTRKRSVVVPRSPALRARAFASRLGYGHSVRTFLAALGRMGGREEHRELFACWLQEMVLRGTSLVEEPVAKAFQETLAAANHPLGKLPLALLSTEREAPSYMPLYGDRGLNRAIDALTSGAMSVRTVPPPTDGASVRVNRIEDAELTERLRSAVRPWSEGKSGKVEAKFFGLDPLVQNGALGSWLLRALPLESTTATARLECSRTGPEGVFGPLFAAASNGGAYSAGLGGAYGRLAAWTSLGALVGSEASAEPSAIDGIAKKCAFLVFRAPGPWFHDVAWDLGAVALRPDGRSIAVLAATDTE